MEFPELGEQCQAETCNQLDFLPVLCQKCRQTFCKDHSSLTNHSCPSLLEPKQQPTIPVIKPIEESICQNDKKCSKSSVTTCPSCKMVFCMDHRLEVDHNCTNIDINVDKESLDNTKQLVDSILKSLPKSDPKVVKNQRMAAKVQLMKLKMKARGSKAIPSDDKVHLAIKSPKNVKDISAVFVSKKWALGKAIDTIADLVGIENKNNVANADKLRLFKFADGIIVSPHLDTSIESLIENQELFDGDTLILEYVKMEDLKINLGKYK